MATNTQRSKASRRVWGCLREVAGPDEGFEMKNDQLNYEVNKFGINVEHDSLGRAEEIQDGTIGLLRLQGWDVEKSKTDVVLLAPNGVRVSMTKPFSLDQFGRPGGGKFTISVS